MSSLLNNKLNNSNDLLSLSPSLRKATKRNYQLEKKRTVWLVTFLCLVQSLHQLVEGLTQLPLCPAPVLQLNPSLLLCLSGQKQKFTLDSIICTHIIMTMEFFVTLNCTHTETMKITFLCFQRGGHYVSNMPSKLCLKWLGEFKKYFKNVLNTIIRVCHYRLKIYTNLFNNIIKLILHCFSKWFFDGC